MVAIRWSSRRADGLTDGVCFGPRRAQLDRCLVQRVNKRRRPAALCSGRSGRLALRYSLSWSRVVPAMHTDDGTGTMWRALLPWLMLALTGSVLDAAPPPSGFEPYAASTPLPRPHRNSIDGQLSRRWRHVGRPVNQERFERDKAECAKRAQRVHEPSPFRVKATIVMCLHAKGYTED